MKQFLMASLLMLCCGTLNADFVFAVSSNLTSYDPNSMPVVNPGGPTTFAVYVYDQAPASRSFDGYNLAFDLGTPGLGFSNTITGTSVVFNPTASNSNPALNVVDPADAVNYDFLVSVAPSISTPVVVGGSNAATKLFEFTVTSSNAATAGPLNFTFVPNAIKDDGGIAGPFNPNNVSFINGFTGLTPTAVPEPTSLAAVGLLGCALVSRMRRKAAKAT